MTNKNLITKAVEIVISYFETEGISEETRTLYSRAEDWYNHTEITNPQTLAAVVISGSYDRGIRYNEIKQIEEFYFPSSPIDLDNFHIGEIEESYNDCFWWD